MIGLPAGTRIWIAAGVTDLRRGFTGLSGMVQTVLQENPFSGHVFLFRGRRGDLVKMLWFDGDGLCLFAKRLERGRFIWPQATSGTVSLTPAQLSMLLEGIDWVRRKTNRRQRVEVPHDEGIAVHIGPESCMDGREAAHEALTGERIGQPLSGERLRNRSVDAFQSAEDNTTKRDNASAGRLRAVWRPWHVRTSTVGNREVSVLLRSSRDLGRTAKAGGHRL
jgi:transposase